MWSPVSEATISCTTIIGRGQEIRSTKIRERLFRYQSDGDSRCCARWPDEATEGRGHGERAGGASEVVEEGDPEGHQGGRHRPGARRASLQRRPPTQGPTPLETPDGHRGGAGDQLRADSPGRSSSAAPRPGPSASHAKTRTGVAMSRSPSPLDDPFVVFTDGTRHRISELATLPLTRAEPSWPRCYLCDRPTGAQHSVSPGMPDVCTDCWRANLEPRPASPTPAPPPITPVAQDTPLTREVPRMGGNGRTANLGDCPGCPAFDGLPHGICTGAYASCPMCSCCPNRPSA